MLFLLEGAGHDASFDPLHVESGFLFWSSISFIILLAVLYRLGWGPLTKTIEDRESKIKGDIDAAETARAEADAALAKYRAQLEEATGEAKRVLEEARQAAERAKQSIVDDAKEQAEAVKAAAQRDIETARKKAIADIRSTVVDVAVAISSKVVSNAVDASEHERLADEVLAKAGDIDG